jgi:hypothetical protein
LHDDLVAFQRDAVAKAMTERILASSRTLRQVREQVPELESMAKSRPSGRSVSARGPGLSTK